MPTFSAEIWTPGLGTTQANRPVNPHRSVSSPGQSGKPPMAPPGLAVSASAGGNNISSGVNGNGNGIGGAGVGAGSRAKDGKDSGMRDGSDTDTRERDLSLPRSIASMASMERRDSASSVHSNSGSRHPSQPGSPNMPLPPRRNILYRIFHPNDPESSRLARSRRSYGSGSEAESEDDYHSDDSADGDRIFHSRPARQTDLHITPEARRKSSAKDRRGMPGMFASSDEGSDTDTESETQRKPKRSTSRTNLFKDLLQGARKNKDKQHPPPASSSNAASPVLAPSPSAGSRNSSDDSTSVKSSDSDTDHHHHGTNLFKDLMMHGRHKRNTSNASSDKSHHKAPVGAGGDYPHLNGLKTEDRPVNMLRSSSETSLSKYGKKEEVLGKGANAVVRLCCPLNSDKKYAIKEFRKRRKDETQKEYVKKLIAEFCISSSLDHPNVVTTVDLIQDEKRQWCVVMEYCAGGDLYGRIHAGNLQESVEVECYLKQLVNGVHYLHTMGVAHRDLKPENLLLDSSGRILKITDFGVSDVFRTPFCKTAKKAKGVCGSGPYIAPEEFLDGREYDSELVDVWSIGIIYYVMTYTSIPWKSATASDPRFKHFLDHRHNFWPLDRLAPGPRKLMYRILDPDPKTRISIAGILEDPWFKGLEVCGVGKEVKHTHVMGERVRGIVY